LQSGDTVAVPDNAYAPNRDLAQDLLKKMGIQCLNYDPCAPGEFPPSTRLVWIEAPGSVSLEVPDVPALVRAAQRVGAVTAMDNTWSAGLAYQPLAHGVDVVMQALTKYPSGGADVLMGVACTRHREHHLAIKHAHMRLGLGVGADDAWLVLRGLATLRLRYEQHDRVARHLALWMQRCPQVNRVLHPALPEHPGHDVWRRDFTGAAGLFSVALAPHFSPRQVEAFVDALRVFRLGYSWGGPVSLVMPYDMARLRQFGDWPAGSMLVRFSVGLEPAEVLQADIEQALAQAF
jgi:cystathionine beta-lyase